MARSGYSEDCENIELWRGTVTRAVRGKRGQAFLRDLLASLDAMPQKRLIANSLEDAGEFCAIGTVGAARGVDMKSIDPDDRHQVAELFNIAPALAAEIAFVNDDDFATRDETPEQRFVRVRKWVANQIEATPSRRGTSLGCLTAPRG